MKESVSRNVHYNEFLISRGKTKQENNSSIANKTAQSRQRFLLVLWTVFQNYWEWHSQCMRLFRPTQVHFHHCRHCQRSTSPTESAQKKKNKKKLLHKKLSWTLHLWPANGFMALEAGTPNSTYQTTSSLEVVILREYQSLSFVCSTESNLLYWSLLYSSSTVLQQSQNQEAPSYKSFGQRKLTCVMKRRKNTNKQNF